MQSNDKKMKEASAAKGRMEGEVEKMFKEIESIEKRRDKELAKGGKVQRLEAEQKELERECTKLEAKVEIGEGNLREEEGKIGELEINLKEVSGGISIRFRVFFAEYWRSF